MPTPQPGRPGADRFIDVPAEVLLESQFPVPRVRLNGTLPPRGSLTPPAVRLVMC